MRLSVTEKVTQQNQIKVQAAFLFSLVINLLEGAASKGSGVWMEAAKAQSELDQWLLDLCPAEDKIEIAWRLKRVYNQAYLEDKTSIFLPEVHESYCILVQQINDYGMRFVDEYKAQNTQEWADDSVSVPTVKAAPLPF